jgi:hypothetical protein
MEATADGTALLHLPRPKDGGSHVVAAPHRSFEKRQGRVNVRCFYCSAFSIFLFEIIISSLKSGFFHAFFSFYLSSSSSRKRNSALEAWARAKEITELHWVGVYLSPSSVFITCTRETTTEGSGR